MPCQGQLNDKAYNGYDNFKQSINKTCNGLELNSFIGQFLKTKQAKLEVNFQQTKLQMNPAEFQKFQKRFNPISDSLFLLTLQKSSSIAFSGRSIPYMQRHKRQRIFVPAEIAIKQHTKTKKKFLESSENTNPN